MKQEEMDLDKYFAKYTKVSLQAAHQQQKKRRRKLSIFHTIWLMV